MNKPVAVVVVAALAFAAGAAFAQTVPQPVVDSTFFHAAFKDDTQFGAGSYFGAYGQTNSLKGFGVFGIGGINGARGAAFWSVQPGANANAALWGLGAGGKGGPNIGLEVGSNAFAISGLQGRAIQVDSGDVWLGRSNANGGPQNTTYVYNLVIDGSVTGAGAPWLLLGNSGTNPVNNFLGTTDAQDLVFRTNNAERMRILSGGYVGIGTNAPGQPLEVKGNALISSSGGAANQLQLQNPLGTFVTTFQSGAQTANINYIMPTAQGAANTVLANNGSGTLSWSSLAGLGGVTGTGTPTQVAFWNTATSISGNNNLWWDNTNSRLGVGTNAPGQTLEVKGNALISSSGGAANQLQLQNPLGTYVTTFQSGAQTANINYTLPTAAPAGSNYIMTSTTAGIMSWQPIGNLVEAWQITGNSNIDIASNFLGTTDSVAVAFRTDNAEWMRLDTTGFLGIGTTSPTAFLDVAGAYSYTGSWHAGNPQSMFAVRGSFTHVGGVDFTAVNLSPSMTSTGSSTFQGVVIAPSFNITSNTIQTGVSIEPSFAAVNAAAYGLYLNPTFGHGSTGYDAVFLSPSGNPGIVGINDSTPSQALEVGGSGNVLLSNTSGTAGQLQLQGTGSGKTTFQAGAQGGTNIAYTLPTAQGAANTLLQNNGSGVLSWQPVSGIVTGSGTATQVAYWNGSNTLTGSSNLYWDNTNTRLGIGTNAPAHSLHSIYTGTTDETAAVYGIASGSTTTQSVGVWGIANNTTTTNTGTIGVLASGNKNSTNGQTNVALQVNSGEFTMGRTTQAPGVGSTTDAATGGTLYDAQGPSGVVKLTLGGGNLTTAAPIAGTLQDLGTVTINNRYAATTSIVLLNIVQITDNGAAPDPNNAVWVTNVAARNAGSFVVHIFMTPTVTNATNFQTGDYINIGYVIVNPSR